MLLTNFLMWHCLRKILCVFFLFVFFLGKIGQTQFIYVVIIDETLKSTIAYKYLQYSLGKQNINFVSEPVQAMPSPNRKEHFLGLYADKLLMLSNLVGKLNSLWPSSRQDLHLVYVQKFGV